MSFERLPEIPQDEDAVAEITDIDIQPMDPLPPPIPRLVWHQELTDPNDQGGWVVEFDGGIMHPYTYVDEFGEDDELSQQIIKVTDYRNRK